MKAPLFLIPALLLLLSGCTSVDTSTLSPVPIIDYSKIGPDESAILAYLDPSLIHVYRSTFSALADKLDNLEAFSLVINGRDTGSLQMYNIKYLNDTLHYKQSCQIGVFNGTHTIQVKAYRQVGYVTTPRPEIMPPIQIALDNIAVTYKVRPATVEEKMSAGFSAEDILYTLEETSVQSLR